ncbi:polysaccharide biosynthesis tyrosine autokinase [Cyanobium sp. Morenito 9A2]|uniref:GumC family protein n=1 Tax=Cyanobium sp. Morenito 9A2 TaxID=2823718 RepID=UPI0020CDA0C9|nr:polysaccharide biosynthesis tyrosine autokinase [Cyanobium sp. Morenito 9A2]MCP9849806.1 polysaccharide biosynthesis tyrosine autokinase [Cyanobium sp. Morenito 9A2]
MTRLSPPEQVIGGSGGVRSEDQAGRVPRGSGDGRREGFNLTTLVRVIRRRRRPFLITVVVVALFQVSQTLYKLYFDPVYQGGFTLLISDPVNDRPSSSGGGAAAGSDGGGAIESLARNTFNIDVPTLIKVLESAAVLEPVYLELARSGVKPRALPRINVSLVPVDAVQRNGLVAPGVLNVSGKGSDQQVVQQALTLAEKSYLGWATSQRQERLNDGLRFLDRQAPLLQAKSDALQLELEQFRKANNLVQPTEEALALRQQLERLQGQLLAQGGERRRLEQVRTEVASGKLSARRFSIGSTNPGDSGGGSTVEAGGSGNNLAANLPNQALLDELQRIEVEIAEARSRYRPGAPVLLSLLAARDQLRPQLLRKELDAVTAALRQNANATAITRAQIAKLDAQFKLQPALLREFDALKQKLEIADGNLANYLRTREQFQLEIAQRSTPWKVISPTSVALTPVEPSLGKGVFQGILFGLVAGAGVALLRDRLDHVFHSPQEVREDLGVPLLGHVPYVAFFDGVRREKRFLLQELDQQTDGQGGYQRFFYQEALRNLYTSLRFLHTDRPLVSVALTSSVPAEGKSLLNVLLAKTLSELGQRVLLVDADLRKPQIHHRLGLDNLRGLTNLLTEEGLDWRDVVQEVPDYPGWSVITAGRRPPDPPRLLGSERMGALVHDIGTSGVFDLVLYDTPPALGLADAALVAQHLEGIVLLVTLNRVDRSLPAEAVDRINDAGVPLLGIVTNARRPKGEKSGAYAYGYGYGYNDVRSYSGYGGFDAGSAYSYYDKAAPDGDDDPPQRARRAPHLWADWKKRLGRWLDG